MFCSAQTKHGALNELKLSDFKFESIFGSTQSDTNAIYCLLGSGFFRTSHSEDADKLIENWIDNHKEAIVVPVSSFGPVITDIEDSKMVYCWVIQGADTLNTYLVRYGAYPGGTMVRPHIGTEKEKNSKSRKEGLLISENEYNDFIEKIKISELYAREHRLGIWKDYEDLDKSDND